jgi:hypothetical protein
MQANKPRASLVNPSFAPMQANKPSAHRPPDAIPQAKSQLGQPVAFPDASKQAKRQLGQPVIRPDASQQAKCQLGQPAPPATSVNPAVPGDRSRKEERGAEREQQRDCHTRGGNTLARQCHNLPSTHETQHAAQARLITCGAANAEDAASLPGTAVGFVCCVLGEAKWNKSGRPELKPESSEDRRNGFLIFSVVCSCLGMKCRRPLGNQLQTMTDSIASTEVLADRGRQRERPRHNRC